MRSAMRRIASTAPVVEPAPPDRGGYFLRTLAVYDRHSDFTSEATTAKPLPASPARAASIVALSASRLLWLVNMRISLDHVADFSAPRLQALRSRYRGGVGLGHRNAHDLIGLVEPRADLGDRARHLVAASGGVRTFCDASSEALTALSARCEVWPETAGERGRGRLHRVGAFAHALGTVSMRSRERGDRALDDGAAAFLRGHRVARLLKLICFGGRPRES